MTTAAPAPASFIEAQVKEYTAEIVSDALENDRDPIEVARRISEEIRRGFVAAMAEQGQKDLALELLESDF